MDSTEKTVDWRLPYRTIDASGSPECAKNVGLAWIEEIAIVEKANDPEGLFIDTPSRKNDDLVTTLYRSTKLLAVALVYRDQMNFAVLIRWLAPDLQDNFNG